MPSRASHGGLSTAWHGRNKKASKRWRPKEISSMLVVIIQFPPIKKEMEAKFLEWFTWSNREFSKQQGFINRLLLKPLTGTNFTAILELENREALASLQSSAVHNEAARRVEPLLEGSPTPRLYEVVF